MAEDKEYDLGKSKKALGPLYPILRDKQGNIIDGFHRQNDDPDWPTLTIDSVDNPVKLELARLASNFCRRHLGATEFQNRIAFLVKSGMKVTEIAEQTGISEPTIYRYMPQELKDARSEAISEGRREQVSRETSPLAKCDRCPISTSELQEWHGHKLCPHCFQSATFQPEAMDGFFRYLKNEKEHKVPEPKGMMKPRDFDSWTQREAERKVQHSKMETLIVQKLRARGYTVETDVPIVVVHVETIPDFNLALNDGRWIRGYIDNEKTHGPKQKDRDDELRELARKKCPQDIILPIQTKGDTEKEADEKVEEIMEAMKWSA